MFAPKRITQMSCWFATAASSIAVISTAVTHRSRECQKAIGFVYFVEKKLVSVDRPAAGTKRLHSEITHTVYACLVIVIESIRRSLKDSSRKRITSPVLAMISGTIELSIKVMMMSRCLSLVVVYKMQISIEETVGLEIQLKGIADRSILDQCFDRSRGSMSVVDPMNPTKKRFSQKRKITQRLVHRTVNPHSNLMEEVLDNRRLTSIIWIIFACSL